MVLYPSPELKYLILKFHKRRWLKDFFCINLMFKIDMMVLRFLYTYIHIIFTLNRDMTVLYKFPRTII